LVAKLTCLEATLSGMFYPHDPHYLRRGNKKEQPRLTARSTANSETTTKKLKSLLKKKKKKPVRKKAKEQGKI